MVSTIDSPQGPNNVVTPATVAAAITTTTSGPLSIGR
jgi:hypothetical protein